MKRVHIGSDHAAFELKEAVGRHLVTAGWEVVDHGAATLDPDDDYPPFCLACAQGVVADGPDGIGIVLGGSGNGEQMAANLVDGVRAALVWNDSTAELARLHNNANVISVGARQHTEEEAIHLIDVFLATAFSGYPRHARRVSEMTAFEENRGAPVQERQ